MNLLTILNTLVKGKVLATTLVGATVLVASGVALAATGPGRQVMQNLTGVHATVSPTELADKSHNLLGTATAEVGKLDHGNANPCDALSEAQQLATQFSLSTDKNGNTVKLICSLHDGSFQVTVNGKTITIDHALGYGEIDELLTYAQSLATKNGGKLTDSNLQNYVTTILNTCGSTPTMPCVKSALEAIGQGNSGLPTSIPTAPANWKPTSIPTVPAGKPTSIPTPPGKQ